MQISYLSIPLIQKNEKAFCRNYFLEFSGSKNERVCMRWSTFYVSEIFFLYKTVSVAGVLCIYPINGGLCGNFVMSRMAVKLYATALVSWMLDSASGTIANFLENQVMWWKLRATFKRLAGQRFYHFTCALKKIISTLEKSAWLRAFIFTTSSFFRKGNTWPADNPQFQAERRKTNVFPFEYTSLRSSPCACFNPSRT